MRMDKEYAKIKKSKGISFRIARGSTVIFKVAV